MSGILAVLDDIAILMDDTAVMAKVAAKKTAGVLGDDLAVGAEKASGFRASRELPVIWAITKGSFCNKLIILPLAFLLNYFAPFLIVPILLSGGVYLAYEGVEKIMHTFFLKHKEIDECVSDDCSISEGEALKLENIKVKSAIKTDFILSIEIIMIALGTVAQESLFSQISVVTFIAVLATVGVYGLVALMVRMDDVGFKLISFSENKTGFAQTISLSTGNGLVTSLPILIKLLAIVGTIAMILVGGGMFVHNIHIIHDVLNFMPDILSEFVVGLVVGAVAYFGIEIISIVKVKIVK